MTTPVIPDRAERFTTNLGLRVPPDGELADLVTVLGNLLDQTDTVIAAQVAAAAASADAAAAAAITSSLLLMGA